MFELSKEWKSDCGTTGEFVMGGSESRKKKNAKEGGEKSRHSIYYTQTASSKKVSPLHFFQFF
jgi:hypothetical protein